MTKNIFLIHLIILTAFISCENKYKKEYTRHVGDIEYDSSRDDSNFMICNGEDDIYQYFNLGEGPVYAGEKSSFIRTVRVKYKSKFDKNKNGLIRIRFIVNCEGQAGRFRILQADSNYRETEFDNKIVQQLLEITQGIEKWVILHDDYNQPVDYYNYLIFRINNGQITEILP